MSLVRAIRARLRSGSDLVTPLGWAALGLGVVAWVVGAVFNWVEWLVIAAAALILVGVAVIYTLGRLALAADISVSPERVVVGDRAAGQLTVTNTRSRLVFGLRIELPIGDVVAPFHFQRLKGGESTDELFVVPTHRRAIIPCGPVSSVQGDPVGLMRRIETWTEVEEIYVHPRTVPLSSIAAGQIRDLEGQTTSALSPSDIAFHTLREYVQGDDLRHVHWKSSAKIGQLMVRQYNDTRRSHVVVALSIDPSQYADEDEYELGISCAASVALQAVRDDQTLTVIAGEREFPAVNPVRLLDHFSGIDGQPGVGTLDTAVTLIRSLAPEASVAVICVGSEMDLIDVRRSIARAGLEMGAVVVRVDRSATPGYRTIGDLSFINVPSLESFRASMAAVVS